MQRYGDKPFYVMGRCRDNVHCNIAVIGTAVRGDWEREENESEKNRLLQLSFPDPNNVLTKGSPHDIHAFTP